MRAFIRMIAVIPLAVTAMTTLMLEYVEPTGFAGQVAVFTALAGRSSTAPYLLLVLLVFGMMRPSTQYDFHLIVWRSPLVLGLPFGLTAALSAIIHGMSASNAMSLFAFWGGIALVWGYSYAVLFEVLYRIIRVKDGLLVGGSG